MNFEELYIKYKNGTATDAEKALIEEEISKARKVSSILENKDENYRPTLEVADAGTVKQAAKQYNKKSTLKTIITVICCTAALLIISAAIVIGIPFFSARNNCDVTRDEAVEYAKTCALEFNPDFKGDFVVTDIDRDLRIDRRLRSSIYVYEIELSNGFVEYGVEVNARSGFARIVDIDR